jgi:hypothetical protein
VWKGISAQPLDQQTQSKGGFIMSNNLMRLEEMLYNLLRLIEEHNANAKSYKEPFDSSTYKYIQDETKKLVLDHYTFSDPIAKDAIKKIETLLLGVPNDATFECLNNVCLVLQNAITKIKDNPY